MADLGQILIDTVYERMEVDAEWSVREPRGFTWWANRLKQRMWVEEPFDDDGMEIWRVHCRTDLIRGFEGTPKNLQMLDEIAMFSTLSGYARDPGDKARLQLASSMYFHEQTADWVAEMMAWVAPIQNFEAHTACDALANLDQGWSVDESSHPNSGERPQPDNMLDLVAMIVAPQGQEPSRFAGPEMLRVQNMLDGPPSLLTTGSAEGIGAEYPFPGLSMLMQAATKEANPRMGHGMLTTLKLPGNPEDTLPLTGVEFNELELRSLTRSHFLGSWCTGPGEVRTFVGFAPNCLFSPATIERLIMSNMMRAHWITQELLGYRWEEHYEKDLQNKIAMITQAVKMMSDDAKPKSTGKGGFFGGLLRRRR